jgi:cation:H+ antiporter
MLPLGADLTVESAGAIALELGVSEAVVAASLIALGTSLPELSTTVIAALHGRANIALGNVIGSNILNILAIMGLTSLVTEVPVPAVFLERDLWVMLGASAVLWWMILRVWTIGRATGVGLLAGYVGYLVILYR